MKSGDIVWVITKCQNTENRFDLCIYRRKLTEQVPSKYTGDEVAWYNKNMKGQNQPFVFEKDMHRTKEDAINHILNKYYSL